MTQSQMLQIVELMDMTMMNQAKKKALREIAFEVLRLCNRFPVHKSVELCGAGE